MDKSVQKLASVMKSIIKPSNVDRANYLDLVLSFSLNGFVV